MPQGCALRPAGHVDVIFAIFTLGLMKVEHRGGGIVATNYSRGSGLISDCVFSIVEDHYGALWMGTEEGLSRLDPETEAIGNYGVAVGTAAEVFCERAAVCLPDGRLLFGSHNGLVMVTPTDDELPPPASTTITGFVVNGTLTSGNQPLSYRQDHLTFQFSNFQYADLQNVVYQYRLEGLDEDWSRPTTEHVANYRHLRPGRYTFRVRSDNGRGVWGEETAMTVVIRQPWWNTWWAWMIYIMTAAALSIVSYIVIRRIMRLHRQLEVERKVSAFKMDFYNRIEREMRNPANVLQGAAENVQLTGTSKTTVQSLRRGSRRMLKLMDMIRNFHSLDEVEMQVRAEQDAMHEEAEQRFADIQKAIHAEEREYKELAPPPINAQTVMVIEDDADNMTHITDTLNPFFRIVGCSSLKEGEAAMSGQEPALVIMDITADEKAARELTRELTRRHTGLRIIHISSFTDDGHQLLSLRAGASDYIVKPFSGKVLVQRIKNCLGNSHAPHAPAETATAGEATAPPSGEGATLLTSVSDKRFLDLFHTQMRLHVSDADFSVERMAELMGLGRTQFYKKVKGLTGETPVAILHRARLDYAAHLLSTSGMTVEDIMAKAGFQNATHFYKSFKKQFGMSPKEYRTQAP